MIVIQINHIKVVSGKSRKDNKMKYYISDLHFGHEKIIQYESRPFKDVAEMNTAYIVKWNHKIKKR